MYVPGAAGVVVIAPLTSASSIAMKRWPLRTIGGDALASLHRCAVLARSIWAVLDVPPAPSDVVIAAEIESAGWNVPPGIWPETEPPMPLEVQPAAANARRRVRIAARQSNGRATARPPGFRGLTATGPGGGRPGGALTWPRLPARTRLVRRMWRRFAIVLSILGSAHAYIWWRFVEAPHLPSPWRLIATILLVVLAPSLPATAIIARRLSRTQASPVLWIAYVWFGCAVYLFLAAALTHVTCAVASVSPRTAALAGITGVAVTIAVGLVHARRGPFVRRVRVPLAKLPADAAGYTIVQLTDVHIGWTLGERFASTVVEKVNALEPDLIVLTGDIVDGHVHELARQVEPLRELRAKDGVYAVTGNHEYYWNADAWLAHLGSLGIRFLRNERVAIRGAFELAGVDDISSRAMAAGHGEDIPRALAGRDPSRPVVLLAHHPNAVERAAPEGADLQLSGHTHGGQLLPLGWLARLFEPQVAGLGRFGATWLYVSEGTGFWGPPLRIGTSCEIAAIRLERAE